MSVPNYKKENGNLSIINYIHTPTTTHQNIYYHTVHKAGNTKVPHVCVQRYVMRKVQIRTILGSFCAKSEDGTNSHFAHNMSYQMYGAVCSIQTHKWVVMVILVRERRRREEGLAWGWEMSWGVWSL